MKKRVADIIMDVIVENGITDCFAVVGGGAMHIDNALALRKDINKVFCHHEQACAMAAEGYAKTCGRMALVSVTSGPGAINTFNGVQSAYVDSTPMLIIAGFPRYDTSILPTGLELRCRGVQEFDAVSAVKGFTKYAKLVKDPLSIRMELQKAIDIADSGRKGPVWLSVPLDVQSEIVDEEDLYQCEELNIFYEIEDEVIDRLNELINNSKRPCILTGSGIRRSGTTELFREWYEKTNIPVVGGALQGDILWNGAPNYFGMSGAIGPRVGNIILQSSDLIIIMGNSMPTKQTGFNVDKFAPNASIVMIDVSEDEMRKPGIKIDLAICADLTFFFEKAISRIYSWKIEEEWIKFCKEIEEIVFCVDDKRDQKNDERVSYSTLAKSLLSKASHDVVFALGNSNGMVGLLQSGINSKTQRMIVNYNSGSMGDDVPEAIGVSVALKNKNTVICVTGDGSVMMNLQDVQTIISYNLDVKIIVMNNEGYGALRQTNKNFFNGVYIGCDQASGVSFPNFYNVFEAFGFTCLICENVGELNKKLDEFLESHRQTVLIVNQLIDDPVLPKVMSKMGSDGKFVTPALHEMYPYLTEAQEKLLYRYIE